MSRKRSKYVIDFKRFFVFLFTIIVIMILFTYIMNFINRKYKKVNIKNENNKRESIIVPDGFYYVGGTNDSGIVISDNKEDENKGTEYNTSIQLKGNQFVWIPIEYPVAENEKELNKMIKNHKYPIAIKDKDGYKGLLYGFTFTTINDPFGVYKGDDSVSGDSSICNREPSILSSTDYGDKEKLLEGSTKGLYQESFNKMVESVIKYKGFFVSRYEIGNLNSNSNVVSKASQTDIADIYWTDGYEKIKNMYSDNKSVSTDMIWGCQFDTIMIYMYSKYSKSDYFGEDTSNVCNNSGVLKATASDERYSIYNIFDLVGNVYEFTQEASGYSGRIARGGAFNTKYGNATIHMDTRQSFGLAYHYPNVGFRATLMIN